MKILVYGSGGREHALCWALNKTGNNKHQVFCYPGNLGMNTESDIQLVHHSFQKPDELIAFCQDHKFDLIVIGPETPIAQGLSDLMTSNGLCVYAPSFAAGQLESSKAFSKIFMKEFNIPTAAFETFDDYGQALKALEHWDFNQGVVIKLDELAAGKGVVVTHNKEEAKETLYNFLQNPQYPVRGKRVVIEQKVSGKEASVFAICDGKNYQMIGHACDYKRLKDYDQGPNTGGMGCFHDPYWPTPSHYHTIENKILKPTLDGMIQRGTPFKGTLFMGLMIDQQQINVLEYNVRFGDPETQTLLPLIKQDIGQLLFDAANGDLFLRNKNLETRPTEYSVHIVMASQGYPGLDGLPMKLDQVITVPPSCLDGIIFYAGVKHNNAGLLVNSGGRVLGVTATGKSLDEARTKAYALRSSITFEGAQWRNDIGL